jgi:hypothetical protein
MIKIISSAYLKHVVPFVICDLFSFFGYLNVNTIVELGSYSVIINEVVIVVN